MQRELTVKEIEKAIEEEDFPQPIIVKRTNKSNLIILSEEEYNKRMFFSELEKEIDESEEEIENGEIFNAREVFEKLRQQYGY